DCNLIRSDIGYSVCRYTHEMVLLEPSCLAFFRVLLIPNGRDSLPWWSLLQVPEPCQEVPWSKGPATSASILSLGYSGARCFWFTSLQRWLVHFLYFGADL